MTHSRLAVMIRWPWSASWTGCRECCCSPTGNQPLLAQQLANTMGESERREQEMDVSIYGSGVSVVNNDSDVRRELAYFSVTSSDLVSEIRNEGKLC